MKFKKKKKVRIETNQTSQNSSSLLREPAPYSEFVRGKNSYQPFTPGGIDKKEEIEEFLQNEETILTIPPGFTKGLFTEGFYFYFYFILFYFMIFKELIWYLNC